MRCKDCANRIIYHCDVHGEIPAERIEKEIKCKDFEQLKDGFDVLKEWLKHTSPGTIEHIYINSIIAMMEMQPVSEDAFNCAVMWIYSLPDSKDVRAIRACVWVTSERMPF